MKSVTYPGSPVVYAPDADIVELRADVAALTRRVTALETSSTRNAPLRTSALLAAIAEAIGTRAFSSAELLAHARLASPALQQAFTAANIRSARRLGKVLERLHGRAGSGLRLDRVERDKHGVIWAVQVLD